MKAHTVTALIAAAGLFAGALAWSFHQEAGFIIASLVCGGEEGIWIVGVVALVLLFGGAALSQLAVQSFSAQ